MEKNLKNNMLGKKVVVIVDRPMGSRHPEFMNINYSINYGYIEGIIAGDGECQDAYILGVDKAVDIFVGEVKAIIHRINDCENKLVVGPFNKKYTRKEIINQVYFQEKYFLFEIEM